MRRLAVAVFLALHGLVHGWYVVLSNGWIEADDAVGWNGTSWLLSPIVFILSYFCNEDYHATLKCV